MTNNRFKIIRKTLEVRVMELESTTRQRAGIAIEASADEFDVRLQAVEREVAARNLEVVSAKRREAHAALRRIDEGTYGICVDCEEPISPARLKAVPWTSRCIYCQQMADSGLPMAA